MKKTISLFFVFVMFFGIAGCSKTDPAKCSVNSQENCTDAQKESMKRNMQGPIQGLKFSSPPKK